MNKSADQTGKTKEQEKVCYKPVGTDWRLHDLDLDNSKMCILKPIRVKLESKRDVRDASKQLSEIKAFVPLQEDLKLGIGSLYM